MSDIEISMEKLRKKIYLTDYYFDNYNKFYEEKAFSKAAEYLWGVLNNLVTSIALFYGHKSLNHQQIISFVKTLAHEKKMGEMIEQMSAANSLHANYYHDFMSEDDFEINKKKTLKLLETLKTILNELMSEINKTPEKLPRVQS